MSKRESMETEAKEIIKKLSDERIRMLISFARGLLEGQEGDKKK